MVKISSIFVAFLENMNFTYYYKALDKIWASRIYIGKFNFKFHYQNSRLVITVLYYIKPNITKKMKLSFMKHTMFMCFANYYLMTECQQIVDRTIISTVTTLLPRDD